MSTSSTEDLHLDSATILHGDCIERLRELPQGSVQMCVTSPPYFGLRDYGVDGQVGHEPTPAEYVEKLVSVFREVHRVLRDDGTLWLNLGDSYASFRDGKAIPDTTRGDSNGTLVPKGSARNRSASTFAGTSIKHKDLIGIPWRVAFALQADGWHLRQDIIWHKPNPMPESVRDRCTKAHEYIFLFSKQPKYYYDHEAVKEPLSDPKRTNFKSGGGVDSSRNDADKAERSRTQVFTSKNRRSVWTIPTRPYKGAHFATFPTALIEPCVLAGSREGDTVLDPFSGSGTTGQVCIETDRHYLGIELNREYIDLSRSRLQAALEEKGGSTPGSHDLTNSSMLSPTYVEGL